jgi:hypothetical protein
MLRLTTSDVVVCNVAVHMAVLLLLLLLLLRQV